MVECCSSRKGSEQQCQYEPLSRTPWPQAKSYELFTCAVLFGSLPIAEMIRRGWLDAERIRDDVGVGGELEELLVATPLVLELRPGGQQLVALQPQLLLGDVELLDRRPEILGALAEAGRPGLSAALAFDRLELLPHTTNLLL